MSIATVTGSTVEAAIRTNIAYQLNDLAKVVTVAETKTDAYLTYGHLHQAAEQVRLVTQFSWPTTLPTTSTYVMSINIVETEALIALGTESQRSAPTLETAAFLMFYRVVLALRRKEDRDGNVWPRPIPTAGEA